jgi:dinuclear metal center YbgI/SA1388 family protein
MAAKEDWDRPGLMVGSPMQEIHKVLLSVDVTAEVLAEAAQSGIDLVISHHPMYLRGVHHLSEANFRGANTAFAIRNGIAVYSAHTNADFQPGGVTQSLAQALGLNDLRPLIPSNGHGAIGVLGQPMKLIDFARLVAKALPAVAGGVRVSGDPQRIVERIGVLAGAGDSYLDDALDSGVDVYLTSDLRHHPAQDFAAQSRIQDGPALVDVAHWAAEWLWLENAAKQVSSLVPELEVQISDLNTDPWTFAVMQ